MFWCSSYSSRHWRVLWYLEYIVEGTVMNKVPLVDDEGPTRRCFVYSLDFAIGNGSFVTDDIAGS